MNILNALGPVKDIIERVVPDPNTKKELEVELAKVEAEIDKGRVSALTGMLSSSSAFVSGGIPALIWIGAIAIFSNYVLLPWAATFGFKTPLVELPKEYWTLLSWIIGGLLAKKTIDGNEIWLGGKLFSPSRDSVQAAVAHGDAEPVGKAIVESKAPLAPPPEVKDDDYYNRRIQEMETERKRKAGGK